jgi:dTDP-4-dehydrorhamnose 3,5-epimerase
MIRSELGIKDLGVDGAFVISPKVFEDERGSFIKIYDRDLLGRRGVEPVFPEDYYSISKKGVIRGLHYQLDPHAQAKLVRVVKGSVIDVLVDLRKSSRTYGKWDSVVLSEENKLAVYIPRGCAHGFMALEDGSAVSYKADNDYAPGHERGIRWNDPELKIEWPEMEHIVSAKDAKWPVFAEADKFD